MRDATAQLCRQAAFAAFAVALFAGALSTGLGMAERHGAADILRDRPILARIVATDSARPGPQVQTAVPLVAHAPARTLIAANAQSPVRQRVATLQPIVRPRPASHRDAAPIKAALTIVAEKQEVGVRFFPDRLVWPEWPVGTLRDRVVGLISSL